MSADLDMMASCARAATHTTGVFPEYQEMVVQFGYSSPIAPSSLRPSPLS